LGRYAAQVLRSAEQLGHQVIPISVRKRAGRRAEFIDLVERQWRLREYRDMTFHSTNPMVSAVHPSSSTVSSILDVIPMEPIGLRRTGIKTSLFFRLAARAKTILTLSEFSAARIGEVLGIERERIIVAPLPPADAFQAADRDDERVLARFGVTQPYFVALADSSSYDPRKRLSWLGPLADGLASNGYQLVMVGPRTGGDGRGSGQRLGRVPDEELAALFRKAHAFVHTSAYEGQGLPPLEAMACGTPVVAMRNSAIPEVVGAGGVLVDEPPGNHSHDIPPRAIDELVDACLSIGRDAPLRVALAGKALEQSSRFTAARFSHGLVEAYSRAG
jgi:glycosyltransferase involved in cell wall biosynthesis